MIPIVPMGDMQREEEMKKMGKQTVELDLTRRNVIKTGAIGVGAVAAGALGLPAIVRAASDTIRIGHITPRSGFLGTLGDYGFRGVNLAVEELNAAGGILGQPHFAPRARRVIYLHMMGGPSQLDLFDYKPQLRKLAGEYGVDGKRHLDQLAAGAAISPVDSAIAGLLGKPLDDHTQRLGPCRIVHVVGREAADRVAVIVPQVEKPRADVERSVVLLKLMMLELKRRLRVVNALENVVRRERREDRRCSHRDLSTVRKLS